MMSSLRRKQAQYRSCMVDETCVFKLLIALCQCGISASVSETVLANRMLQPASASGVDDLLAASNVIASGGPVQNFTISLGYNNPYQQGSPPAIGVVNTTNGFTITFPLPSGTLSNYSNGYVYGFPPYLPAPISPSVPYYNSPPNAYAAGFNNAPYYPTRPPVYGIRYEEPTKYQGVVVGPAYGVPSYPLFNQAPYQESLKPDPIAIGYQQLAQNYGTDKPALKPFQQEKPPTNGYDDGELDDKKPMEVTYSTRKATTESTTTTPRTTSVSSTMSKRRHNHKETDDGDSSTDDTDKDLETKFIPLTADNNVDVSDKKKTTTAASLTTTTRTRRNREPDDDPVDHSEGSSKNKDHEDDFHRRRTPTTESSSDDDDDRNVSERTKTTSKRHSADESDELDFSEKTRTTPNDKQRSTRSWRRHEDDDDDDDDELEAKLLAMPDDGVLDLSVTRRPRREKHRTDGSRTTTTETVSGSVESTSTETFKNENLDNAPTEEPRPTKTTQSGFSNPSDPHELHNVQQTGNTTPSQVLKRSQIDSSAEAEVPFLSKSTKKTMVDEGRTQREHKSNVNADRLEDRASLAQTANDPTIEEDPDTDVVLKPSPKFFSNGNGGRRRPLSVSSFVTVDAEDMYDFEEVHVNLGTVDLRKRQHFDFGPQQEDEAVRSDVVTRSPAVRTFARRDALDMTTTLPTVIQLDPAIETPLKVTSTTSFRESSTSSVLSISLPAATRPAITSPPTTAAITPEAKIIDSRTSSSWRRSTRSRERNADTTTDSAKIGEDIFPRKVKLEDGIESFDDAFKEFTAPTRPPLSSAYYGQVDPNSLHTDVQDPTLFRRHYRRKDWGLAP